MFDNNTNKSYLVEFDNFLSQLVSLFENNDSTKTEFDIVTDIKNEKDEDKLKRGKLFHSCLEEEDCFDLFLNKKVNSFSNDELKALEIKLKEMEGIDNWMLNRQKDFDSGENKHLLTTNLNLTFQFDKKRLQKIKSYRGLRLAAGLPVRGQRTKAHFRKGGKAVGVKRKGKK